MTASASVMRLLLRSNPVNSVASAATEDGAGSSSFPTPETRTKASHTTRTTTMTRRLTAIRRTRRRATSWLGPGASTTVGASCVVHRASLAGGHETPRVRFEDDLADRASVLREQRIFIGLDGPRPGQLVYEDLRDPAGPRRHDDDPVGQEDGLLDAVGDEDDGLGAVDPDPLQLEVHPLAGQRVERAEWLVHQQQRRV